ncbi:MAG TPA: uroporphyrinogen decarboxylase [Geminicoccaceae bacterium]|nr:uroporphyrinogen decarboxylase [Geminicoccaceae bacterium]
MGTGQIEPVADDVSPVLGALRRQPVARPPVWLMRQAGRYLPEYRALRASTGSFLQLCYTPELACEVTLQPVRRFGMDAAILFSDILVVADGLGCPVAFVEGSGPKLEPVRSTAAVVRLDLGRLNAHLAPVYDAVARIRQDLPARTALIGFAGAPWTVAAYMVEGEGSKEFYAARTFARRNPAAFAGLIELLTEATIGHLRAQIEAGADVLQLFDSWAGVLPEREFLRWCQEPTARIVWTLKAEHPSVPIIAFPRGAGLHYRSFVEAVPVDGLSLDTAVPAADARRDFPGLCLQGNLDPVALLTGGPGTRQEAEEIVRALAAGPFIFNLGHGVLPDTDPEEVARLVTHVRSLPLPAAGEGMHG